MKVQSTEPPGPVRLTAGTELVVEPLLRTSNDCEMAKKAPDEELSQQVPQDSILSRKWLLRVQELSTRLHMAAGLPFAAEQGISSIEIVPTWCIFVNEDTLQLTGLSNGQMTRVSNGLHEDSESQVEEQKQWMLMELKVSEEVRSGHAMIAASVRGLLSVTVQSWVKLQLVGEVQEPWLSPEKMFLSSFELERPEEESSAGYGQRHRREDELLAQSQLLVVSGKENCALLLQTWLHVQNSALTLSESTVLQFAVRGESRDGTQHCFFLLHSENPESKPRLLSIRQVLAAMDSGSLQVVPGYKKSQKLSKDVSESDSHWRQHLAVPHWLAADLTSTIRRHLVSALIGPRQPWIGRRTILPRPGGLILSGPQAGGKSQTARAVVYELQDDASCLAHPVIIACRNLLGLKESEQISAIKERAERAVLCAPSTLLLDDLDLILPAAGAAESSSRMVEFMADLLDYLLQRQPPCAVAVMAVCSSESKLPPALRVAGRLSAEVAMSSPDEKQRSSILHSLLRSRSLTCSSKEAMSSLLDGSHGFELSDMESLADRLLLTACPPYLLKHKPTVEVTAADVQEAIHGFVPAALRNLPGSHGLRNAPTAGWAALGGLEAVRAALRDILELPSRHSKLFSECPLRLRSGALLYGPPGCGKTHIVQVATEAIGVRCVSVKGPELLDKYIGASEQAVRDVFARAAQAAPCVLFFDEFDALAPKRGHDNTGVTDRVVNQLLTELDGVEGLSGVNVLAATSRPDLIDSALLRPGRLDRLLLCDLPNFQERIDIFGALSRDLRLSDDVDFADVARGLEGFSGADLQSVLADAQLASVHRVLERRVAGRGQVASVDSLPEITQSLLIECAGKARASLPANERQRLSKIYQTFVASKSVASSRTFDHGRVTLS